MCFLSLCSYCAPLSLSDDVGLLRSVLERPAEQRASASTSTSGIHFLLLLFLFAFSLCPPSPSPAIIAARRCIAPPRCSHPNSLS